MKTIQSRNNIIFLVLLDMLNYRNELHVFLNLGVNFNYVNFDCMRYLFLILL